MSKISPQTLKKIKEDETRRRNAAAAAYRAEKAKREAWASEAIIDSWTCRNCQEVNHDNRYCEGCGRDENGAE